MLTTKKLSIIFLFFIAFIANAQTTYYCDPVNGNNGNDGSQATPFAAFGTVNWSSKNLQDNDIIMLLDGQHGNGFIQNYQFATNLLIKSVNPQQAVLTKMLINGCSNITLEDLKIDASTGSFAMGDPILIGNESTHYITINNCLVQAADDSSTWTKTDWYNNTASGIQMRGDHITVTNSTFLNLYQAVEVRGDYTLMQNNLIENFAADAIRGLGSYSTYEYNTIKNAYIDDYAIQHDDAFQVFQSPGSAIVSNVTFSHNTIILFENPSQFVIDNNLIATLMQGVIITDGNAEGWVVDNNLIINSQSHGITLYGARNCRIQNNTVVNSPYVDSPSDKIPWISVQDQGKTGGRTNENNTIRNNMAGRFTTWTYGTNTTDENNVTIGTDVTKYDEYFIDYANEDFHSIETSVAVNYGINIDLSATDLDGNTRIFDSGIVDASCYEYQGTGNEPPVGGIFVIKSTGDGMISDPAVVTTNNPAMTGISTGSPAEPVLFVGGRDANHDGNTSSAILPFRLPARPNGELVVDASLKVNMHYITQWITSSIDLYGLPYNASSTIYAADHYDDAYNTSHGTDTAIQDNLVSRLASEANGTIYTPDRAAITDTAGNDALIAYLNAQYDAGAVAGDYIFLRLNIDVPINPSATSSLPTAASHYFGISDETTGDHAPTLTLEISDSGATAGVDDELLAKSNLMVYPNPVSNGSITLKSELLTSSPNIEIYAINGALVYANKLKNNRSDQFQMNINLSSGVYILRLSNDATTVSKKLIVK